MEPALRVAFRIAAVSRPYSGAKPPVSTSTLWMEVGERIWPTRPWNAPGSWKPSM